MGCVEGDQGRSEDCFLVSGLCNQKDSGAREIAGCEKRIEHSMFEG